MSQENGQLSRRALTIVGISLAVVLMIGASGVRQFARETDRARL